MRFPTPDEPAAAPVWENYVVAQAAHSALRRIPTYVHALGVEVDGTDIRLVVQRPPGAPAHDNDLDDIVDTLSDLLGPDASVTERADVRSEPELPADAGVRWFFAARVAWSSAHRP